MAEYYPLLSRAVSGLRDAPAEARRAIYDRARQALLGQLRSMQPPVPEEDIQRESTALDDAIARVEGEIAGAAASSASGPPVGPALSAVANQRAATAEAPKAAEPSSQPAADIPAPTVSGPVRPVAQATASARPLAPGPGVARTSAPAAAVRPLANPPRSLASRPSGQAPARGGGTSPSSAPPAAPVLRASRTGDDTVAPALPLAPRLQVPSGLFDAADALQKTEPDVERTGDYRV